MCGRVIQSNAPIRYGIVDRLNVRDSRVHNYPPRWNGAPSQDLLVIRRNHKTGEISLDPLRWGLFAQSVKSITPDHRSKRKLQIGVDVPTNDEIKRLYEATGGDAPLDKRKRALLLVAAFCGLRASELRGLRWRDVNLDDAELKVEQRADRFDKIGSPKTASSRRTVPMSPDVVHGLREWKMAQGSGGEGLVSPEISTTEPSLRFACSQRCRSRSISSSRPIKGVVAVRSASNRLSTSLARITCQAWTGDAKPLTSMLPRSRYSNRLASRRRVVGPITTLFGAAAACRRAARFGVSPTTVCS
jgi:integrase